MGNQRRLPDEGRAQRPHGERPDRAKVQSTPPNKYWETKGRKDYKTPGSCKTTIRTPYSSIDLSGDVSIQYKPASVNSVNLTPYTGKTLYYRFKDEHQKWVYTEYSGTLYTGYSSVELNQATFTINGGNYNSYNSVVANVKVEKPNSESITILGRKK